MGKNKNGNTSKYPMLCANCKYWEVYDEKKLNEMGEVAEGECHRYPPRVMCVDHINEYGVMVPTMMRRDSPLLSQPFTFAGDWCGEFKPMKNPRCKRELHW